MATPASKPEDVFDLKRLRRLVDLMIEHDLSALDLRQDSLRISLRRGRDPVVHGVALPAPASAPAPRAVAAPAEAAKAEPVEKLLEVKSPMVGTFYAASSPDASPYVKIGDVVRPDTTVCLIEAMKVFNEIPAEVSGRVVAVCVQSGDPVDHGKVLFKLEPTG